MSFRQGENSVLRAPVGDFVPLDRVAYEGAGGRCVGRVMEVSDDGVEVLVEVLTLNEVECAGSTVLVSVKADKLRRP